MIDGRIIKGIGGLYTVATDQGIYMCKPRGIFRKDNIIPLIGDFVKITIVDEIDDEGAIEEILPRRTELIRPKVSNIDLAVLVFTIVEPELNKELIDRFVVLAEAAGLEILICINKIDLVDKEILNQLKDEYKEIGYDVVGISTLDKESINTIEKYFDNKVSVFAGPSGVGKSSIINLFIEGKMEVGIVSEKSRRGKHTTRHAELIEIKENTYLVDSPGFTSISINHIEKDSLQYYFKEFRTHLGDCRFKDCAHINEPKCKIKESVGDTISQSRYNRYVYFYNELTEGGLQ